MGLTASGPCSRVLMDEWRDLVGEVEEKSGIMAALNPILHVELALELLRKYVDDSLSILEEMRAGTRWDGDLKLFI